MLNAEHRRPLAAFLLVLAFASVVMANGLRDQVVRVFVDSGAPRPLISAVVPDIVLGHALRHAPAKAPESAAAEVPASTESQSIQSRPVTPVAAHVVATTPIHTQPHHTGHVKHHAATAQPVHLSTPKSPVHVATPSAPTTPTPTTPGVGSHGGGLGHGHTGGTNGLVGGGSTPHHSWSSGHDSSDPSPQHSSQHGVRGGSGEVRGVQATGGNEHSDHGHHGGYGHHSGYGHHGDHATPGDHGTRGDHGGPGDHGNRGDHGGYGDRGDRGHGGYSHHRH
jgi:hypothetical protein